MILTLLSLFSPIIFFPIAVFLYLWYKYVDCDLTLLFYDTYARQELQQYNGKVIWITGASSGIGEEIAYQFAALESKLVLSGTRKDALDKVRAECIRRGASEVMCVAFDIADHKCHQDKLKTVLGKMGNVHVLVNNAGRLLRSDFISTEVEAEKELFNINVFGVISLCRVLVKHWQEKNQVDAQLFVTSSASGKMGSPFTSSYAATKHALHGYLETLRDELTCAESSITVTIGCPGPVRSAIRANAFTGTVGERYNRDDSQSQRKLMSASRCAGLIVSGLAHRLDELWIAEQPLLILYYVYQYLPSIFRLYLIKQVMTKKRLENFRRGE